VLTSNRPHQKPQSGFTLIEAVMTIILLGIVAGVLAPFIAQSMTAFQDTSRRSEMTARARLALERIAREVRIAVPNTIRTVAGGTGVEFISTKVGGRYMSRNDPFAPGVYTNASRYHKNANLTSLFILGTSYTNFAATDSLVIYNTSPATLAASSVLLTGVADQDADGDGNDEVQLLSFAANSWGVESTTQHYQIANFTHELGLVGNAIHWRRVAGINAIYDGNVDYGAGNPMLISSGALTATFEYLPTSLTSNAILKVTLRLTEDGESITVSQEIHVRNSP
jgi:MSHA biogenesis protein MshO